MVERMFGTNGIRGIINEDMTSDLALQMGKAIGAAVRGNVAVATDTRITADMIKRAISAGIMSSGHSIYDLGIVPMPALQYYVKTHDFVVSGIMITASHNPPQFNGIKYISEDGTEASRIDEAKIEELYSQDIKCVPWDKVGKVVKVEGAGETYIDAVVSHVDVNAIREAKLKVCLDCANGSSLQTSPLLLKKLEVQAITLNANPQGVYPGHSSEPTEENLSDIIMMTKSIKPCIGVAHDSDADRCIFITSEGEYVSGDKALALMSRYILSQKKGPVVVPINTSSMVEDVVLESGGSIVYTSVGSPIVARKMVDTEAVFGGEENGGLIFPEMQFCRDSAMAIAKMLEFIVKVGPLSEAVSKLPEYYSIKIKIPCPIAIKKKLLEYIEALNKDCVVDHTDGVKILFDDGWVLVRPSGTEPIFRIFSESKIESVAKERAEKYESIIWEYLDPEGSNRPSN